MIDIETEVFTTIRDYLLTDYPDLNITGVYEHNPTDFPCVFIIESNNSVYDKTSDTGSIENHARLTYTVEVYSNKRDGKKAEAKSIFSKIDEKMSEMGFYRTMKNVIPNEKDATIFRLVARYEGVADKNKNIYRR